jgi:prevent-host-death family protein
MTQLPKFQSADLTRHTSELFEAAILSPVAITKHRKPKFVLMSMERYRQLSRGAMQQAYKIDELPEDLEAPLAEEIEGPVPCISKDHFGYKRLANDYLDCALFLQDALDAGNFRLKSDFPILSNLSHATELAIKGHLLCLGMSKEDLVDLGHDLERAYGRLGGFAPGIVTRVETHVKSEWKSFLRKKRDDNEESLKSYGIHDPEVLREFGVFSNDDIGKELPTFKRDLKWLSDRHRTNGSRFRYFEQHLDRRPHVRAFGLNMFTVPCSIAFGTKALINLMQ